jgi:hypothetical protein
MMRERASDNIGMAADTQLMQMNANTHISVSVPANTKIYVVWTQHEKGTDRAQALERLRRHNPGIALQPRRGRGFFFGLYFEVLGGS